MKASDRNIVLWQGASEHYEFVKSNISAYGLDLANAGANPAEDAVKAKAFLVEYEGESAGDFRRKVSKILEQVLNHGLLIVLINFDKSTRETFSHLAKGIADEESNSNGSRTLNVRFCTDVTVASVEILKHNPRAGASRLIKIRSTGITLTDEQKVLFRRAFWDIPSLEIHKLTSGFSGAKVCVVWPKANDSRSPFMPFLVKVGKIHLLEGEIERSEKWVVNFVPFSFRPAFHPDRLVYGRTDGLLVQDFVSGAETLEAVIGRGREAQIISSLIDGALECWRSQNKKQANGLLDFFDTYFLPKQNDHLNALNEIAAQAERKFPGLLAPQDVFSEYQKVKDKPCWWSKIHGDLHPRNVLVLAASSNPILIDVANVKDGPQVADLARLEVDLALKRRGVSQNVLKRLYAPSTWMLEPYNYPAKCQWFCKAVNTIRRYIPKEDFTAYKFALSCFFFRFSSRKRHLLNRRIIAYYLAQYFAKNALQTN